MQSKVFQNAKWIIGCKIIQSLLQMVVGMLSARYLGPSNYGLINYAASIVAFAAPLMQLGLHGTLVQEYVVNPEREGQIMGTSLVLNLLSGAACIVGVTCFAAAGSANDRVTVAVCAIYSIQLVFQSMEMLLFWYQAKLLSKYSSLATLGAYVVVSAYKIWLLATRKSIYWFALSHSVEYCVMGIAMLVLYKRLGGQRLSFSWELAKDMFSRSKYYILASMMNVIYNSTDHVMLTLMMGEAENGFYTAAAKCAGIAVFVFAAIRDSARSPVLQSAKESREKFEKNIIRLYTIFIYLSLAQSIGFTILAKPIVRFLYGEAYMAAVPVLRVLGWMVLFSNLGMVRNLWILTEEKYDVLWRINLGGAVANVILNAFMIPVWGAWGAAFASMLTQAFMNVVLGFLMPSIRQNNRLMMKGLHPKQVVELIKSIV